MTHSPQKSKTTPEEQWVRLASVVRPQGRKGEMLAELLTDFPERFVERRRLFLRSSPQGLPRAVILEQHWLHKGRLVLKFQGIDTIESVELVRGHDVVIPREERAPLDEDSVYIGDLAGCLLYDRASAAIVGEILDVDRESTNTPLIVVRPVPPSAGVGGELLIPFAKAYLPQIDLDSRRMEMTLPEGLLALNAPLSAEEKLLASSEAQPDEDPGAHGTTPSTAQGQALAKQRKRRR